MYIWLANEKKLQELFKELVITTENKKGATTKPSIVPIVDKLEYFTKMLNISGDHLAFEERCDDAFYKLDVELRSSLEEYEKNSWGYKSHQTTEKNY